MLGIHRINLGGVARKLKAWSEGAPACMLKPSRCCSGGGENKTWKACVEEELFWAVFVWNEGGKVEFSRGDPLPGGPLCAVGGERLFIGSGDVGFLRDIRGVL